jgi:hypothetical protein
MVDVYPAWPSFVEEGERVGLDHDWGDGVLVEHRPAESTQGCGEGLNACGFAEDIDVP